MSADIACAAFYTFFKMPSFRYCVNDFKQESHILIQQFIVIKITDGPLSSSPMENIDGLVMSLFHITANDENKDSFAQSQSVL